jgi:microcystin-dependent protein
MEGTIAEIRMFAGNFAPRGWAFCQGQLLSISQYTAVFALLGTTYGGNGQTTFGLPDFRGRIGDGTGQGPGLSLVDLGEQAGVPSVTLTTGNLPSHNHTATLKATNVKATTQGPVVGAALGRAQDSTGTVAPLIYTPVSSSPNVALDPASVTTGLSGGITGGAQPFSTMQPYLGMNFIICLEGIFPSRN